MKNILKNVAALGLSALALVFISSNDAAAQRGRGGIGFHGGVGFGGGFSRGGFGFRGGFGGIGFGYRSYYRPYFGGYYGYAYPALGFSIGYLPYGYLPFYYGPDLYYAYEGVYYQQTNDKYVVVAPPIGAEVPKLPAKAKSIMINNEQYYEMDGIYYKTVIHPDGTKGYQIAGKDGVLNTGDGQQNGAPQIGDIVPQLPQDSRAIKVAGKSYWVSPDDYYYEEVSDGKNTSYKIVGVPDQGQPVQPESNKQQPVQPQIHQQ